MFFRTFAPLSLTAALLLLSACHDEPQLDYDYFSWDNPITGATVKLPEGWRRNPEIVVKGETTVGYFTPNFSNILGGYAHITLHYEDLRRVEPPMTLERFVGNFVDYMRKEADHISEPVFEGEEYLRTARLSVETRHRDKQVLLRVRFWTSNGLDYWYAVAESLVEDGAFAEQAAPVIELLRESSLPPP